MILVLKILHWYWLHYPYDNNMIRQIYIKRLHCFYVFSELRFVGGYMCEEARNMSEEFGPRCEL